MIEAIGKPMLRSSQTEQNLTKTLSKNNKNMIVPNKLLPAIDIGPLLTSKVEDCHNRRKTGVDKK